MRRIELMICIALSMILSNICVAQVILKYSGVLYDSNGIEIVNSNYEAKMSILSDSINGGIIETVNKLITTNGKGKYEFEVWTEEGGYSKVDEYSSKDYYIKLEIDLKDNGNYIPISCSQILKERCDNRIGWLENNKEKLESKIEHLENELKVLSTKNREQDNDEKYNKNQDTEILGKKFLDNSILVEEVIGGYNPYNSDKLWLPNISIRLKNVSSKDISDYNKIRVTFIDMNYNEKLSSTFKYFSTENDVLFKGSTVTMSLKSEKGWTILPKGVNVIAKISFDGKTYYDFPLERTEYRAN